MDTHSIDSPAIPADRAHPALTLFDTERAALGILERETRFVPGAPETSGTYIARSVIYAAIGEVSGRSAVRELARLGFVYCKGTKWLRITEAGARFAVNAELHTTRSKPGRWETLVAGRPGKPAPR